jgi:biotin transport system substrate-specific component
MSVERVAYLPLASQIWPEQDANRLIRFIALAIAGTAILTLSAKIKVPFYPVEMTMQTCAVLLIGAAYGSRLGLATVVLYLLEGASGLPVFTGTPERGVGVPYMLGPTGGYLLGFAAAAALAGLLAERGYLRSLWAAFLGLAAADVLVFGFGTVWLGRLIGWDMAVAKGVVPFLLGDLLKVALAATLLIAGQSLLERRGARD